MKKFGLVLFAVLLSFNANAFDLTEATNKFANDVNKTSEAVEAKKAEAAAKKAEYKAKAEVKMPKTIGTQKFSMSANPSAAAAARRMPLTTKDPILLFMYDSITNHLLLFCIPPL